MTAFLSVLTTVAVVLGAWLLAGRIGQLTEPTSAPWSSTLPVLGGRVAETHAWSRFHFRYYPMTLLFIAFEMEMMFMYPWAVVYVRSGTTALVEMAMFLGILSLGILYAWREGAFRWQ